VVALLIGTTMTAMRDRPASPPLPASVAIVLHSRSLAFDAGGLETFFRSRERR
jgi:hypothetical protein